MNFITWFLFSALISLKENMQSSSKAASTTISFPFSDKTNTYN